MFGRRATLPIDISMTKDSAEDLARLRHEFDGDVYQLQQKTRLDVMVSAKRNILAAQERQKQYYDAKRANPHLFMVGEQVLLKDFGRKKRKGGKLTMRYIGPYDILSASKKGVFVLKHSVSGKISKAIGSHLKLYIPRDTDDVSAKVTTKAH